MKSWSRLPRMGSRYAEATSAKVLGRRTKHANQLLCPRSVHALIKREPAITIIPRICSDFLGRTSERRPSNVDGWTLPIKRSREKRKGREERKRNERLALISSFEGILWLEEIFEGGGGGAKKQVELIRLFASRETFRE